MIPVLPEGATPQQYTLFLNQLAQSLATSFVLTRDLKSSSGFDVVLTGGIFKRATSIADQVVHLPASTAAIYVECDSSTGLQSVNTTGWTGTGKDRVALASTSTDGVASWVQYFINA